MPESVITLHAPWGAGAVLGLLAWVHQAEAPEPGPVRVVQIKSRGDMPGALAELHKLAAHKGRDLMKEAPWTLFAEQGDLGEVVITKSQALMQPRAGWRVFIKPKTQRMRRQGEASIPSGACEAARPACPHISEAA